MKSTYNKNTNCIIVELEEHEFHKYKTSLELENIAYNEEENTCEYTIPCTKKFYEMSERQANGVQPWGPYELREAVKSVVANALVPFDFNNFDGWYQAWSNIIVELQRNIRLKFPDKNHPRERLSQSDVQMRRTWREAHVISPS